MTKFTRTLVSIGAAAALGLSLFGCGSADPAELDTVPAEESAAPDKGSATVGDLAVEDAWLAEPATPSMTAGYLTITNTGEADTALVGVETSLSDQAELHTVETTDSGASRMIQVSEIPVPAGGGAELVSGGFHIMVLEMGQAPQVGDTATITLTFSGGETVQVEAPVLERAGSTDHDHHDHDHHDDH